MLAALGPAVPLAAAGPAGTTAQEPAAWPDAGDVVGAFTVVREWLDAFSLPSPRLPEAAVAIRDASGVCIVVRRGGKPVGTGTAVGGDDGMLRRAAGRAFGSVLADPAIANLPEALRNEAGPRLSLELEVAGGPRPLVGATFEQVARSLDPGLEAVALRRGERAAMAFPSQLRASRRSPDVVAIGRSLAVDLDLPPVSPVRLRQEHGASLYRAATVHLAQAEPSAPPFETFRGQVLVSASAVTTAGIAATADALARHVMGRFAPAPPDGTEAPLGLAGDYDPFQDRYQPLLAPPLEQALLAAALTAYATAPGVDAAVAGQARAAAVRTLRELARVHGAEPPPTADRAACAAVLLAADRLNDGDPAVAMLVGQAEERLLGPRDADEPPSSAHGLALIAAVQARRLVDGAATLEAVRRAIDAAWASAPGPRSLELLPWILWAERDWAAATGSPLRHREDLLAQRGLLDRCRIGHGLLEGPADLDGGFALAATDLSGRRARRATAQSLRPAAAVATMLREPSLVGPEEAPAALGRHLATVRFLMQLTVRPESTWSMPNPRRAAGGVRSAPWDDRQPAAAQAMGLLVLAETLQSLRALAR